MRRLRSLLFRLQPLFRRRRIEAGLNDEIRSHLELATEAHIAAGLSPAEARRAAERDFGGVDQVKESWRDQRSLPWLDHLGREIRRAFRSLRQHPGFCLVSILMLALGVAASTLTFGVTDAALLRPLPFPHPERLLRVWVTSRHNAYLRLTPGAAVEAREQLGDIGQFALYLPQTFNVSEPGGTPEPRSGLSVSANFLKVLGVQPVLGRGFLPDEDEPNAANVTLITYSYWQDHFAGDPHVLGKPLKIETGTYTIIGVLPPSFGRVPISLWPGISFVHSSSTWREQRHDYSDHWMNVVCRLKPGVTRSQASTRLSALAAQLAREHPAQIGPNRLRFTSLGAFYVRTQVIYWLVVGLAAFVLLIAAANLGVVQLARALARRGELAIRSALGARRGDLIAVVASESLVVTVIGSVLGVLAVHWGRTALEGWVGGRSIAIDFRVVAFVIGLTGLAGLLFGMVPAWLVSGGMVNATLKTSSPATTWTRSHRRVKRALIVGQIGLALVLVSAAFSLVMGVRSFIRRDRGWQPAGLVSGLVEVTHGRIVQERKHPRLAAELRSRLGAIPGVQAVAVASDAPVYGSTPERKVLIEGAAPVPSGREPRALVLGVDRTFFQILHIPLRKGRLLPAEYRSNEQPVVVVSASFARRFWPGKSAIGRQIKLGKGRPWREIVGVVGDVSLAIAYDRATPKEQAYIPSQDLPGPWVNFILKTSLPASALAPSIRRAVAGIDPVFLVGQLGDLPQLLEDFGSNRPLTVFLTIFAGVGLLIALIGLYGMMGQNVQERRREIGIRMALGADGRRILRMMLAGGFRLLAIGVVIGLALSIFVLGFLHRGMPGLPVPGLPARVGLAIALVGVGAAACYLPSRRACRVDPVEVLRAE